MKTIKKLVYIIMCSISIGIFVSCSKQKNISEIVVKNNINTKKYTNTIVCEYIKNNMKIYNVNKQNIKKVDEQKQVAQLLYDKDKSIFIYLANNEENKKGNNIKIVKNDKQNKIQNFFTASDLKISDDGEKLAYRTFKNQSLNSAEGVTIYDLHSNKNINIKSETLVSGNLYSWKNKNEILYYGVNPKNRKKAIYKYDFNEKKENIYLDNIKGYCMYFMPFDTSKIFLLESNRMGNNIYIYNKESNKKVIIANYISNIYNSIYDKNNKCIYVMASKGKGDVALYSIDTLKNKIERITFDFPRKVDSKGGISVSKEGLVYYCGYTEGVEENNEVFMYNPKDKSNNLISSNPSKFHIFKDC